MAAECGDCDCGEVGTQAEQDYMDCVATQIIENSPCKGALENFMEEHGVDLSLEEQVRLIGPGGITDCGSEFENEVFEHFENHNFIVEIENGEIINPVSYTHLTLPTTPYV